MHARPSGRRRSAKTIVSRSCSSSAAAPASRPCVRTRCVNTAVSPKHLHDVLVGGLQASTRKPSSAAHCAHSRRYSSVEREQPAVVWNRNVASGAKLREVGVEVAAAERGDQRLRGPPDLLLGAHAGGAMRGEQLVGDVRGGDAGDLGVVVRRRDLDDVGADEVRGRRSRAGSPAARG